MHHPCLPYFPHLSFFDIRNYAEIINRTSLILSSTSSANLSGRKIPERIWKRILLDPTAKSSSRASLTPTLLEVATNIAKVTEPSKRNGGGGGGNGGSGGEGGKRQEVELQNFRYFLIFTLVNMCQKMEYRRSIQALRMLCNITQDLKCEIQRQICPSQISMGRHKRRSAQKLASEEKTMPCF